MAINPYGKLKNDNVETASKEELTLMLYDGAVKFCNRAIIAVEKKDFIKANEMIKKVQDIIREFQLTLNRKYEVSKFYESMYEYIHEKLIDANTTKNLDTLNEALDMIRELRDLWKEAVIKSRSA